MKKLKLFIVFVIITSTAMTQNTKKIKSHEFKNGTIISIGDEVEFIEGKNPVIDGEFLWSYEGQEKRFITKERINSEMNGRKFIIERLFVLKGIKPRDNGIIASFPDGDRMIYVFISQSIKYGEIKS